MEIDKENIKTKHDQFKDDDEVKFSKLFSASQSNDLYYQHQKQSKSPDKTKKTKNTLSIEAATVNLGSQTNVNSVNGNVNINLPHIDKKDKNKTVNVKSQSQGKNVKIIEDQRVKTNKRRLKFKNPFIEVINIESFKLYNSLMCFSDPYPDPKPQKCCKCVIY